MATALVIGAGQMGRAITVPLCDNGSTVHLISVRSQLGHSLHRATTTRSPQPHRSAVFHREAHSDLQSLRADLLVIAASSVALEKVSAIVMDSCPKQTPILLLTKGLIAEPPLLKTTPEALAALLTKEGAPEPEIYFLGGPYVAGELAMRRNTSVILAGSGIHDEVVRAMLGTSYFHIHRTHDLRRVAFNSALKNLYAISIGIATGEEKQGRLNGGLPKNPTSAAFAQALEEMNRLSGILHHQSLAALDLSGAGDLYATCGTGRNHRAGILLGQGINTCEIESIYMRGETIEGINLARNFADFFNAMIDDSFPLLRFLLDRILCDDHRNLPWELFFQKERIQRSSPIYPATG
jgi:glycerol-3-phosphate dehydrogenase (NAD(P)+)